MIDLQRFCANDNDPRPQLRQPWKHGEWVYATNGHVCVRVPAATMPDVAECDKAPAAHNLFTKNLEGRQCEFLLMPKIAPLAKCRGCNATGKVRAIKCAACKDGQFKHYGDTYDCQRCAESAAGPGWDERLPFDDPSPQDVMRVCYVCDGLGADMRENGNVSLGESTYSRVYLSWLAALPQVRVCPGSPTSVSPHETIPAVFIFDGGHALLMPRRD